MRIVRTALSVPLPRLFDYTLDDASDADLGRCVRVPFGRGEKNGVIVALPASTDIETSRLKPISHIQRDLPPLPEDWLNLVRFVAQYYHAPLGEVIALALPPGLRRTEAVRTDQKDPFLTLSETGQAALTANYRSSQALALIKELATHPLPLRRSTIRDTMAHGTAITGALKKGWLTIIDRPTIHTEAGLPVLTPEQQQVLETVHASPDGFTPWLLHGVTGSGKTEIYLRLAAETLKQGKQVLMLVPEIALTSQLERRVEQRFGTANIISLHSGLAQGARSRGFVQALLGQADIVLGTRLAIFAPLPRLGLILIDEEHDASYKQQEGVRYSARDIAVWRARQHNVPIILGSATPSLESWHHVQTRRYRLLSLHQRAIARTLPAVRYIDTRREILDEGMSQALYARIEACLARGEQSLVFINRRGYAPVLSCTACGWISQCPHCSANLVVHLTDRRLRCHHCGCEGPINPACPSCGNQDIQPFGRGTQRVEARLIERFPQARVLRIDRDAARTRTQWEHLLSTIADGGADILVGTQMMAKGHDFPKLTLVGVLGADASLHAADFRAPERLFQQLMQVGGRAGRGNLPGEVLIQTEFALHPLYQHLARHDFSAFAQMALEERQQASFPPYSFQAMLRADAPEMNDALAFLRQARTVGESCNMAPIRLFDPVPMRMSRLARRERAQLLIEANQRGLLQNFLSQWVDLLYSIRAPHLLRWQLDVDPLEV